MAADDALYAALTAPRESSFIDALFALPDEVEEPAQRAMIDGLQAALAAKMRARLDRRGEDDADAA